MANRLSLFNRLRSARTASIAALLMLFQAIIPTGFMPVWGETGPALILCTGEGRQAVMLSDDASAAMLAIADALDADDAPDAEPEPCDFAATASALAAPDNPITTAAPAAPRAAPFARHHAVAIGQGLAAPPPPQTGPPLTF